MRSVFLSLVITIILVVGMEEGLLLNLILPTSTINQYLFILITDDNSACSSSNTAHSTAFQWKRKLRKNAPQQQQTHAQRSQSIINNYGHSVNINNSPQSTCTINYSKQTSNSDEGSIYDRSSTGDADSIQQQIDDITNEAIFGVCCIYNYNVYVTSDNII